MTWALLPFLFSLFCFLFLLPFSTSLLPWRGSSSSIILYVRSFLNVRVLVHLWMDVCAFPAPPYYHYHITPGHAISNLVTPSSCISSDRGVGRQTLGESIIVLFVLYLKGFTKGGYQFGKCCWTRGGVGKLEVEDGEKYLLLLISDAWDVNIWLNNLSYWVPWYHVLLDH